jgi:hypothetical protein
MWNFERHESRMGDDFGREKGLEGGRDKRG